MANALTKDLEIMFENIIEGFDTASVISKEADTSFPNPQSMQRAQDVFYRPMEYNATTFSGLDISAQSPTDAIQRQVPTVFRPVDSTLFKFNAEELRDPYHLKMSGKAAAKRLAGLVDTAVYTRVANEASIVIKKIGALSWTDGLKAEAALLQRGLVNQNKKMFLNPVDYQDIAIDLGSRAYMGDLTKNAYQNSQVPDIATFSTFRTDNLINLAAVGTVSGSTVSGTQSFTPTAMTVDLPTDNRRMTLVVAGVNIANIKNGDAFILNMNSVHNITKDDTGVLQTFRVISGGGSANLVITPPIIATGAYQNVTAAALAGTPLVFLNTVTKPVTPFWQHGAVTLDYGKPDFYNGAGEEVMQATTKQGVPIQMIVQANSLTGTITVRSAIKFATTVLNPEACGIIIANQT